jgi:hypothetical protein
MRNIASTVFVTMGSLLLAYSFTERAAATEPTCAGGFFWEYLDEDPGNEPGEGTDWFMQCIGTCPTSPPGCHQGFTYLNPPANTDMITWCGCTSVQGDPPATSPGGCSLTVRIQFNPGTGTSTYTATCHETDCTKCTEAPGTTSHGWSAMCDCED